MLMTATTIQINQNRKLPVTVGLFFRKTNGSARSSTKRNRNHPTQHQKDVLIGYPNKVSLSVSHHLLIRQVAVIKNRWRLLLFLNFFILIQKHRRCQFFRVFSRLFDLLSQSIFYYLKSFSYNYPACSRSIRKITKGFTFNVIRDNPFEGQVGVFVMSNYLWRAQVFMPVLKNRVENRYGRLMELVVKRIGAAEKLAQIGVLTFAPVEIAVRPFSLSSA